MSRVSREEIDFFGNSTTEENCFVDTVLESSCTGVYTLVLRSVSPRTASFRRSLMYGELTKGSSKQGGMILPTTVLMLFLLTLLVLSQMQMVFLYYKALNQLIEKHQSFYNLESEANKLALNNNWLLQDPCLIKEHDPNDLIKLLKNKQGCALTHEKQQFFYLVEELGLFPCLQTQFNKETYSTEHLRINIISTGKYPVFLQLRFARLAKLEVCKNSEPIQIKTGLLSWRLLSEVS